MPKTLGRLSGVATLWLVGAFWAASAAPAEPTYEFNLPQQALADALRAVGRQTTINILFDPAFVKNVTAPPIQGVLSAEQAVKRLLVGTKLTVQPMATNAIVVGPVSEDAVGAVGDRFQPESGVRLAESQAEAASPSQEEGATKGVDKEKPGIQEIVVTAQKRKESLKDVPISISVLSGKQLDSSTFSSVTDAIRTVPGLDQGSTGFNGGVLLSVRGVANPDYRGGGAGPVAYYLDGVPYGFVRNSFIPVDGSVYDLQRIEVLRGPQGTLYGANALNGVIRVLTQDANVNAFEMKARTSLSTTQDGGENYGGDLAINVPIIEGKLAARAVLGYLNNDGWIDSFYPTQYPANPSLARTHFRSDVNSQETKNYRLKVRAQPTDSLSINLSASRLESELGAPDLSSDQRIITALEPQPRRNVMNVFGFGIEKDFPSFSISSMTSYMKFNSFGMFDGHPIPFPVTLATELNSKVLAQELNFASNLQGRWRWSAGVFYREGKDSAYQLANYTEEFAFFGTVVDNDYSDTSDSAAIYGELGRRFLDDRLDFSFGLRYFRDKQRTQLNKEYTNIFTFPAGTSFATTSDAVTPRAVLTWAAAPDQNVYATYSQGFRSGFSQEPKIHATFPFPSPKPDKVSNYEIGTKGSVFGGRLAYEAAAYYIDWQDIQQSLFVFFGGGLADEAVINGESASGPGAELALTLQPLDRLELNFSVGWNDLTFDSNVIGGNGDLLFPKGGRLQLSPEYTGAARAQYTFPFGGTGFSGKVAVDGDYKSSRVSYYGSPVAIGLHGPSVITARVRLSIEAPRHWEAALYADNITNERDSSTPSRPDTPLEWSDRFRPRTIGVQLEYRFD